MTFYWFYVLCCFSMGCFGVRWTMDEWKAVIGLDVMAATWVGLGVTCIICLLHCIHWLPGCHWGTPPVASPGLRAKRGTELKKIIFGWHTKILWNSCNKQWQSYWPEYFFLAIATTYRESSIRVLRLWSDQKIKQLQVLGARAPVLHSWRRQCKRRYRPNPLHQFPRSKSTT